MKRVLLLAVVVGLFAGPALAGLSTIYTLDEPTALKFTSWSVSTGDLGLLVFGPTTSPADYGAKDTHGHLLMSGEVGWVGMLGDQTGDDVAVMTIHSGGNAGLNGSYIGYRAFVQNDDDDPWDVRIFMNGHYSAWAALAPYHGAAELLVTWITPVTTVTDIGLEVYGNFSDGSPSNPDVFHISAVPIPGAALLGVFGLLAAGVKLRRFV